MPAGKIKLLVTGWFFGAVLNSFGAEGGYKVLSGHVPPAVSQLAAKSRLTATNLLSLSIGLPLRNPAELDELLRQLYDPASANYHKFLTPAEFAARFGPAVADYQNVIAFARSNGLAVAATYPNRLVLDVAGPVASVERAFLVTLRTYRHPTEPRDFFAPDTEPSVPANLKVISVEGLTDFSRPRHAGLIKRQAASRPAALNGSGPSQEYAGVDFRNAYVPGTTLTGAGQSIALLEYSDYFPVDITNYENIIGAVIGVTNYVPVTNILVGKTWPGTSENQEPALDIEMVVSLAPMLSQVYVYEKNSVSSSLLNQIATDDKAKQVSSSWAVGPWSGSTANTYDNILKNMAAQGQSYFQASMDEDAYTGSQPLDSGTLVPVDDPYATVCGGTTLSMNGTGASWASEIVWNWNLSGNPNVGSGGGISAYYAVPAWQTNISLAGGASPTNRNIPDVALTADDLFLCYDGGQQTGNGSWEGGTSAAAPLWAAFCALANQLSLATNGTYLGFLNPALYNIAASSCYGQCFHDITNGNNIGAHTPGLYYATNGYDLCTGLGTPMGTNLINALVWPPPVFTNQPAGKNVTNGASVTFTANASSTTPLAYFWLFNGANLPAGGNVSGVATNTLVITAITTNNIGNYQLVASNYTGFVTSSVAVLNVGFVPSVSVAPASLTLLAGSNAVFTATPGGSAPFVYQWKKNGTNFAGAGITGTNTAVLTLAALATNSTAGYTVVVTNLFGSITSSIAALTVVLPPSITSSSLTNRTLQCGSNNVTFTFNAAGTAPLNYQWSLDGAPVANATNTSFSVTNLHLPNHTVGVLITNLYASVSSNALLTVQDTLPPAITLIGSNPFFVQFGQAFADPGATATDLCEGAVGVVVSGSVNTNAVGTNTLVYTAGDGNGNTNTATRTVILHDTTPPTVLWSFTNLVLAANSNCAAATPNVTGTNYIIATDLSGLGKILQTPTTNGVLSLGTNTIVIAVSDIYSNTAYSTNTIVVQDETPPVITLNGSNPMYNELGQAFVDPGATADDACAGPEPVTVSGSVNTNTIGTNTLFYTASDNAGNTNTVTRTVIVRDTTPPVILWSFTNLVLASDSNCVAAMPDVTGTNDIIATDLSGLGAILQTPTMNSVLSLGTNTIVISVADIYGNTAWSTNTIVVQDVTPPVILTQPQGRTNIAGASASFSVAATACTPLAYQWYFNLAMLAAQTNGTLTLSNLTLSAAGNYAVVVSASGGAVTSSVAVLAVDVPPGISGVAVNPDGTFALTLLGSPGSNYVLQAATNLLLPVNWLPIATNTPGSNGVWQFTDLSATNFPRQFYRLMFAP